MSRTDYGDGDGQDDKEALDPEFDQESIPLAEPAPEPKDSVQLIMDALTATEREMGEVIKRRAELDVMLHQDYPKDSLRPDAIARSLAGEGLHLARLVRQHAALQKAWPA